MRSAVASLIVALATLVGRHRLDAQDTAWQMAPALSARHAAAFHDTTIHESSGVAASRLHPGLLWTIEDSGAEPVLHATDTTGADRGTWQVTGASNVDWEAVTIGRCPGGSCVYLGDIGDNNASRASVTIYRVREPDPARPARRTLAASDLRVRYPGGARDVEAMVVLPSGSILLVSKGRSARPRLFRLAATDWASPRPVTATDLGPLPLPDGSLANLVTDAALAPDGRVVAIRTYTAVYFFRLTPEERLVPIEGRHACGIFGIEPQGEGIAWLDARTLVTTSEDNFGMRGGLGLVRCTLQ